MDIANISQQINKTVRQAEKILLVVHQQPDADALGSLAALSEWLDQLPKKHWGFCLGTALADCTFINEQRQLIDRPDLLGEHNFDLVMVLDSGDLKFAGFDTALSQLPNKPLIINIDHHATNQNFGQINLVQTQASATTEILYHFFHHLKVAISPRLANALLAGIINDTYGFTNPNTSAACLATAAALLKKGAKLKQVSDAILKNKTVSALKLWGVVLNRLSHNPQLNIATTVIAAEDLQNNPNDKEITEGISNFLNNLSGVNAALVLRQESPQIIKGSLRTNSDLIDVSQLALALGGGGHRKAAGFKIKGRLAKTTSGDWQII